MLSRPEMDVAWELSGPITVERHVEHLRSISLCGFRLLLIRQHEPLFASKNRKSNSSVDLFAPDKEK